MQPSAPHTLHATEREIAILKLLAQRGFVAFRELEQIIDASPATLRRDLERLASAGRIGRVHGGALSLGSNGVQPDNSPAALRGVPFHENIAKHADAKRAIGRAAAILCQPGEGIMIDGGSTTLQMCPHLGQLGLQVLTNSLHAVSALLPQANTRVLVAGGTLFREQNIILSVSDDDLMPSFHAPKLFMGAASIGHQGVMQPDTVLAAAERRLIDRADQLILLVDSSKFDAPSGYVVCALDEIDVVITNAELPARHVRMLKQAGVRIITA